MGWKGFDRGGKDGWGKRKKGGEGRFMSILEDEREEGEVGGKVQSGRAGTHSADDGIVAGKMGFAVLAAEDLV